MEVVEAVSSAKTKKFKTNRKKVVDAINKLLHNLVSLLLTNKTIRSDANSAKRVCDRQDL
ncbi:hypothetical protein [Herbaspirillum camelliae]|uniref:hypothetical protein n=1 Tax=Herbaspirillum camelliae TaxID=1892903 RepID=UPI00117A4315|nr:hypothetical protein [Herbaspirillum camelliae]